MLVKNILYAEDNPDDAFIVKLAFKRTALSWALHCVEDGEDAIRWLRGEGDFANRDSHPLPDLLLLDLKMPKKSGFEVLEWVKKPGHFETLPVVILSSSDDPKDLKHASELGALAYFKKSAGCEDLMNYLKSNF